MEFQVISDSSCDLPANRARELGVEIVPFYVSFDGANYMREGVDVTVEAFYQMMADQAGVFPKTSMPPIADYMAVFEKYASRDIPVLCICLNAGFSGSCQSAVNARMQVLEKYPHARIEVLDSELVTLLQGMLVEEACRLSSAGAGLDEARRCLEEVRSSGHIFFTTNDLEYLEHGGRIGRASAAIGGMLKLKPLIEYADRELSSGGVVRGRKKSVQQAIQRAGAYIAEHGITPQEYRFGIAGGLDQEEFEEFKEQVTSEFVQWTGRFDISHVGVTIGVHTGPHPIGIGLLKRCRRQP